MKQKSRVASGKEHRPIPAIGNRGANSIGKPGAQVSKVLSAMCDAVVALDEDLCISGGAGDESVLSKMKALLGLPISSELRHKQFAFQGKRGIPVFKIELF